MKTKKFSTAISLFALALAAEVRGESAADIGTLPSQKVPASLDAGDRNPFATRLAPVENEFGNFDSESEESRIRQVFANLAVTGRGSRGRVLVGDLILEEGKDVPHVIENQTDVLRVTRINKEVVEITWVDDEVADAPRKLPIAIQLNPTVMRVLPGRGNQGGAHFVTVSGTEEPVRKQGDGSGPGEAEGAEEEDEDGDVRQDGQAQPEQPKRVSPFGLFRR